MARIRWRSIQERHVNRYQTDTQTTNPLPGWETLSIETPATIMPTAVLPSIFNHSLPTNAPLPLHRYNVTPSFVEKSRVTSTYDHVAGTFTRVYEGRDVCVACLQTVGGGVNKNTSILGQ